MRVSKQRRLLLKELL